MIMNPLRDLSPRNDVKGGSPKTPPGGISLRRYHEMIHTDKPNRDPGVGYVELRDFFTLWIERLEVFYTRRFEDLDTKTTLALSAADKAVTKAEVATEKRFEGVNEFRQTLADQAARLMPREEALSKFTTVEKDLNALTKEIQNRRDADNQRRRDSSQFTRGWVIPVVIVGAIAVINLIINLVWTLRPH